MPLQLDTCSWSSAGGDWLIVGLPEGFELTAAVAELDQSLAGALSRVREAQDFTGKLAEVLPLRGTAGVAATRVLLVGLGAADQFSEGTWQKAYTTAARHVSTKKTARVAVAVPAGGNPALSLAKRVELAALSCLVGSVGQDLYRAEKKRVPFENVSLLVEASASSGELQQAVERGQVLGEAINLCRELVNLPASVIYPASFADRAQNLAGLYQIGCDVLDENQLRQERMGSMLAVAQGSNQPPRLVVLEYNQAPAGAPVLALVGKGVTFDSGGLSIKSNENMLTMKCDMAGAATVLATMTAIARLKLPVHVVGLMGLVENMTGGSAMKLGDVLTSRAGVTIEVQNTDAEGRLVLADVLDYAVSRGAEKIVDLATLTGACVVALGEEVVGAMTNNQEWCNQLLDVARSTGEDVWQLPMFDHYNKLIESDVADIRNVGGRWGGAITAAKFLERFVHDKPWVHLDIAGPAFASSDKPHREGGATGVMVRTLVELAGRLS